MKTNFLPQLQMDFSGGIGEDVYSSPVNPKTFKDLQFKKHRELGGVVSRIHFENGYGASVVKHEYSYGGKDGLYELAVLDKNGELCYDTPITDDVVGYLRDVDVTDVMEKIQQL
jgi:hypothetical protein